MNNLKDSYAYAVDAIGEEMKPMSINLITIKHCLALFHILYEYTFIQPE